MTAMFVSTDPTAMRNTAPTSESSGILATLHDWVVTVDHKRLGIMYVVTGLVFLVIGGIEAFLMRLQLAWPGLTVVPADTFNRLFTVHGTTMVFLLGIPVVFGFANYLVPLMIGARDLAFPRLNAFGFWILLFGGALLYFSFIGGDGLYGAGSAPAIGWFAYAPLSERAFTPGNATDYWNLSVLVMGFGTVATAINLIATISTMRAPGMTLGRMPIYVWTMLTVSAMTLLILPPLSAAQIMLLLDRYLGAHFFDTQAGGSAIMWQHFFWFFGHPEVYVLMLPGFGFVSEIIPVFSRKVIFSYTTIVLATVSIGAVSLSVWAHHMFTVGMGSPLNSFFALSTMLISVPTGIKIFNWLAHALLLRFPLPVPVRGPHGDHALGGALQLAAERLLLRGGPLPLRPRRQPPLHHLRRDLLLVPQGHRAHALRAVGALELLAPRDRLQRHLRHHARAGPPRHAATDLHLHARPWVGDLEPHHHARRAPP